MAEPFETLAKLDHLAHEPARLVIMTALSASKSADFLFLQRLTGLAKGNLSSHLSKLEEANLLRIEKQFVDKMPSTIASLTERGRAVMDEYWRQLEKSSKGTWGW